MAAAAASKMFRTGSKKIFLPDHMITFLRPHENQPPQFASFKVPLRFNKLDIRDYLFNAYGVPVLGVRSQLRQQPVRRSKSHKRIHRPPPIKTMTVELTKPFVWPARPEDKSTWNSEHAERSRKTEEKYRSREKHMERTGKIGLRPDLDTDKSRTLMKKEARRLQAEGGWTNDREVDPKFKDPRFNGSRFKDSKFRSKKR